MKIRYIKYTNIDKYKWDKCIRNSINGIVYAYSWYLDKVSDDWDALISDDYDAVMPLTFEKKFGQYLLIQPIYTQQLGIFSNKALSEKVVKQFINTIPSKFRYININLNTFNFFKSNDFSISEKHTYEMDLIESYDKIFKRYSSNTKRNLKKAKNYNIKVISTINSFELLNFKKENSIIRYSNKIHNIARRIISLGISKHLETIYGAYSENNSLLATAFFISTNNKSIYLIGASSTEGKEKSAMFALVDKYIADNCEKNLTLDFEGSNIKSVARFFKGFGAKRCIYLNLVNNNLPWYLKIFKK